MLWIAISSVALSLGPQPLSARPSGSLDGRIVYLHPGHGWTWEPSFNTWLTQRGESFEIVEDFGNQDIHTEQADVFWRAGATVVPLRPIGHQPAEVVLDNVEPAVTFEGPWNNSISPIFFGTPGEVPYRFASTSPIETAIARYTPDLPQSGVYPVYAWTRAGFDRVNQLYRVHHAGGTTELRVDHRLVGNGLVYLGSYRFNAGANHSVEISNQSNESGVVIADMIRFGNGMGDIDRGGGVSGFPREDEAGLYWIEAHAGVGIPSSEWRSSSNDGSATVSAPPRWAEQMNREAAGTLADRVFISHHSNAANGIARGTIALLNGNNNPAAATPNQLLLAGALAGEINDDLVSISNQLEHAWADRSTLILDRTDFEFGEINNLFINDEFDATIVERGFHDNQLDAELMRSPVVQRAVADSTYQGTVRYFNTLDPSVPLQFLPPAVGSIEAIVQPDGSTRISWIAPTPSSASGSAPTSYLIQQSDDGFAFDRGFDVGNVSSFSVPSMEALRFYRVVARNAAGESRPSQVVGVARPDSPGRRILLVDGFDRLDREQNFRQGFGNGVVDRVRPNQSNPGNTTARAAQAMRVLRPDAEINTTTNERVVSATINLSDYDLIYWQLGEESSETRTLDSFEQIVLRNFVDDGGNLAISGSELAWELGLLGRGVSFLNNTLGANFVADDAGTYVFTGVVGTPFAGLQGQFDDGTTFYDTERPDALQARIDSQVLIQYDTGAPAAIGLLGNEDRGSTILLGFPTETITDPIAHQDTIRGILDFLVPSECLADVNVDGAVNGLDFGAWLAAFNAKLSSADQNQDGEINGLDFGAWLGNFNAGCS